MCAFLAFGLAMWSQLVIGWQWSPPRSHPTTLAIELMSCCVAVLVALGVLAVVPLLVAAVSRVARGSGSRLAVPLCVAGIAVVVLVVGAHVFEDGWPGTGGHPWSDQGLVPGGVAAFFWAATLGVTSYWAHPGALSSFPVTEVVWMAVSPVAIVALAAATATVLRRLELSERAVRYELRVGQAASAAMSAFFVGACLWLFDGQLHVRAGQVDLFHAGAIDVAGAVVMALCILCAHQAVFRGLAVARRAPGH
jgi:energy-coupling factor transporter transmembrane protein EcfT